MTKTKTSDLATLLSELAVLLRLTRTEAQVARVRISQARDEETRRELADNAKQADARAVRIQGTIRRLGGAPDIFADAVGRVTALTKATIEQGQPFSEGLLGDLALEHQLRDRAVFVRVLAEAQDESRVVTLMRKIEEAHAETIDWIVVRLAEVAQGGPSVLTPTPAQAVVGTFTRLALLPTRSSVALVNRTVNLLQRGRDTAEQTVEQAVETTRTAVKKNAKATSEIVAAGRDAALARAEEVAPSDDVRKAAHEAREDLGTIDASDLPVESFDSLSGADAVKAVKFLEDAEDVRVVLSYEQAHKDRKGVSTAAEKRITELAESSVDTDA